MEQRAHGPIVLDLSRSERIHESSSRCFLSTCIPMFLLLSALAQQRDMAPDVASSTGSLSEYDSFCNVTPDASLVHTVPDAIAIRALCTTRDANVFLSVRAGRLGTDSHRAAAERRPTETSGDSDRQMTPDGHEYTNFCQLYRI